MGWDLLIPLIIQVGLPVAEAIWQKAQSGTPPTQKDFDELNALANSTANDHIKAILVAKGIPLDSDAAKKLLA